MRCKCMLYVVQENATTPSCSKQDPGLFTRLQNSYDRVYDPGNGWFYLYKASQLLLVLEKRKRIDVAPFFKEKWGKLTEGRHAAIAATMPEEVELTTGSLDVAILEAWLERAKKADTPKARKARRDRDTAAASRREAATMLVCEAAHKQEEAAALRLSFGRGFNRKHQRHQWQHRAANGTLYVLRQEDSYALSNGCVPVEVVRELVPAKIYLVSRLDAA